MSLIDVNYIAVVKYYEGGLVNQQICCLRGGNYFSRSVRSLMGIQGGICETY